MKIEMDNAYLQQLPEEWPGQYNGFSRLEAATGIPQVLYLLTTLKENGKVNACFHGWTAFAGDSGGYYAIVAELFAGGHTWANLQRDGEFCISFMRPAQYDACIATIRANEDIDGDELAAAGLTAEPAKVVRVPRVAEAFLSLECRMESALDPSGLNQSKVVIARVVHAAVEEGTHSPDGFMTYQYTADDLRAGAKRRGVIAKVEAFRDS